MRNYCIVSPEELDRIRKLLKPEHQFYDSLYGDSNDTLLVAGVTLTTMAPQEIKLDEVAKRPLHHERVGDKMVEHMTMRSVIDYLERMAKERETIGAK